MGVSRTEEKSQTRRQRASKDKNRDEQIRIEVKKHEAKRKRGMYASNINGKRGLSKVEGTDQAATEKGTE